MSARSLGSRAILGRMFKNIEMMPSGWVNLIGMYVESDQESEEHKWLGEIARMKEWIGGRKALGLTDYGIKIYNKKFENTISVFLDEIQRDKTGQVMRRVNDLVTATNEHWVDLMSQTLNGVESLICYDGQYLVDTDHVEELSGTQSNDISVDISALPVNTHGTTTNPSAEELQEVILTICQTIMGLKSNAGRPFNPTAQDFLIKVPITMWKNAAKAMGAQYLDGGTSNILTTMDGFNISVRANAWLNWTDKIMGFRTDGNVKPFILQEEYGPRISYEAEGSALEHKEDRHEYGVKASRNIGPGFWQTCCMATMI